MLQIDKTRAAKEFTDLSMFIHPHHCSYLTVLLWSFSPLLFWSTAYSICRGIKESRRPFALFQLSWRHILYLNITSLWLQLKKVIVGILLRGCLLALHYTTSRCVFFVVYTFYKSKEFDIFKNMIINSKTV